MEKQNIGWRDWFDRMGKRGRSRPEAEVREFADTLVIAPPQMRLKDTVVQRQELPSTHGWFDMDAPSEIMDSRPLHGPSTRDFAKVALDITGPGGPARGTDIDAAVQARPSLGRVGRYALKTLLGRGGLGQVHEAWDPLLSRAVAVKTLQFDLPQPVRDSLDGMILNEARAAAGLNHAYIVTVFDAGLSDQGVYIAMERLRGRDLRHALSTGWLPSPRLASVLVRRVADALAYAHGRGVVHCDIKPANIFLIGRDRPKVLDFGIARIAHATAVPALDGVLAGSPYYQAPEQIRGTAVDSRTDLYALGTVLYELLTGRRAFGGDSVAQIQDAVLHRHPTPAHEIRPDVPVELSEIAARAMSREPRDRFISAIEMSMMLRHWADTHAAARPQRKQRDTVMDVQPARPPTSVRPQVAAAGPAVARAFAGSAIPDAARTSAATFTASALTKADAKRNHSLRWPPNWAWASGLAVAGLGLLWIGRLATPQQDPVVADGPHSHASVVKASQAHVAGSNLTINRANNRAGGLSNGLSNGMGDGTGDRTGSAAADAIQTRLSTTGATTANLQAPAQDVQRGQPTQSISSSAIQKAGPAPATASPRAPITSTVPALASPAASAALGSVQLAISPWGRVEVNGKPAGTTPPLTHLSLPEGSHSIVVRNEDFPPYTATVVVEADRPATLRHRFGP